MSDITAPTEIIVAPSGAATMRPARPLTGVVQNVRSLAGQPAVMKSLPLIGLIAVLGILAIVWMSFSAAPGRTLFQGLPDEDKAAVAEALKGAGLPYQIDRDTGALTVSDSDYYQARMLLAAQGLPKSAPDGGAMIENLPLGASRAVEGERLRTAREMDLARTIEAIDAVKGARVHLATETASVFLRDVPQAAASVMLRLNPGRTLSDSQVQAIIHLVASSVPGLAPDGVSVVDQAGRLLSRESSGGGGAAEASERQIAVQSRIEDRYRQSLTQLLTPILGDGNFTTEVHADLDFSETQATREGFPKEATAVTAEETSLTVDNNWLAGEAGGVPGALSNQAPPAAQIATQQDGAAAAPGATDQQQQGVRNQNTTRSFAVGREVSITKQQTGQVKRLSVAVALRNAPGGKTRTREEVAAIEALVKGAVGFDQTRGDVVAINARTFAEVEETAPNWWEAGWVSLVARNVSALAVAALVVFGLARPLIKRATGAAAKRAELDQAAKGAVGGEIAKALADHSAATGAAGTPSGPVTIGMIESANSYEGRAALIRDFVRQDPARAALVVRDLIRADTAAGGEQNG